MRVCTPRIQPGKTGGPKDIRSIPARGGITTTWYVNKSIYKLAKSNCVGGPGDDCCNLNNG